MINTGKIMYALEDLMILPAPISEIETRKQCNPYVYGIEGNEKMLPLIASPMDSVVSTWNWEKYLRNKVSPVIPRNVPWQKRIELCGTIFCAFSMAEVEGIFLKRQIQLPDFPRFFVLIDIANGHMKKQIELGYSLKKMYGEQMVLMGGNIAHWKTYQYYDKAGFDYLRVGIGGGQGCLTSRSTAIGCPMGSLLDLIYQERYSPGTSKVLGPKTPGKCKIIADGGIKDFSDIIKCLSLGADYVMMGYTFSKMIESAGTLVNKKTGEIVRDSEGNILEEEIYKDYKNQELVKEYHGMSTKEAQAEILGIELNEKTRRKLKTSEGRREEIQVLDNLQGWTENFESFLRSSMSYSNSRDLAHFRNNTQCIVVSDAAGRKINNK